MLVIFSILFERPNPLDNPYPLNITQKQGIFYRAMLQKGKLERFQEGEGFGVLLLTVICTGTHSRSEKKTLEAKDVP